MAILSLNAGSSTLKYAIYEFDESKQIKKILLEGIVSQLHADVGSFQDAARNIFGTIKNFDSIKGCKIDAIGCRVVHGGPSLRNPVVITPAVLSELRSQAPLAPLHNPIDIALLEACHSEFPNIPVVAVFDTGFHQTLPAVAKEYALPKIFSSTYGLQRYGFHGIAHQYLSQKLYAISTIDPTDSKVITCHLGNGASVCAVKNGISIDTSMGFTPMEGLVMGNRAGDIDPGLLLYLLTERGMTHNEVEELLNFKSGLLGLSNQSSDVHVLEIAQQNGDQDAAFALDYFSYRVSKYIGAYFVALGGLDAIVFSGGIGEHSTQTRALICERLSCLGIYLDSLWNGSHEDCYLISQPNTNVQVWVIAADENRFIAENTFALVTIM